MKIKVAIVEDKAGVRENWARLINAAPRFECVSTFETAEQALAEIPRCPPDVVLMDIQLPGMSGTECAARLKAQLPQLRILIVTIFNDSERIFGALKAGASGYLLKTTPPAELLAAIHEVLQGGGPMTGEIARRVIDSFRGSLQPATTLATLTEREEECLRLLAQGYSNKEIAVRMNVTAGTVHAHLKSVYEKLHVRSRVEAATEYLKAHRPPS